MTNYSEKLKNNLNQYYELPQEHRSELIDEAIAHLTDVFDKKDTLLSDINGAHKGREITGEDIQVAIISGMMSIVNHLIQYQLKKGGQ